MIVEITAKDTNEQLEMSSDEIIKGKETITENTTIDRIDRIDKYILTAVL